MGLGLPTSTDITYPDSGSDATVKLLQQYLDALSYLAGLLDIANLSGAYGDPTVSFSRVTAADGDAIVFSSATNKYAPGRAAPRARDVTLHSLTATTGTTTLDFSLGVTKMLTLNTSTTLGFSNLLPTEVNVLVLYLKQDGTGGRSVTWWGNIKWSGGTAPALSSAAGSVDKIVLSTLNNGANWFGEVAGQAYA